MAHRAARRTLARLHRTDVQTLRIENIGDLRVQLMACSVADGAREAKMAAQTDSSL